MGLSPLTGDLATGKDLVQPQEPFTCLSWNILLGWHSLAHRSAKDALMVLQQPLARLWLKVKKSLTCFSRLPKVMPQTSKEREFS